VVVAVVIGALLLPSATRPPIVPAAAQSAGASTTVPPSPGPSFPTASPARSTTTTTAAAPATTAVPTVVPGASAIHVTVANGTSITGLAGGVAAYLRSRGFGTISAVNATTKVSATQVYAAAGQQGAATTVVNALGLTSGAIQPTSAVAPVATTSGATAVVIAGPDLARYAPTGSSTSATH
jgi:hypothetical protein